MPHKRIKHIIVEQRKEEKKRGEKKKMHKKRIYELQTNDPLKVKCIGAKVYRGPKCIEGQSV